jgi:hypothetical protein
MKRLANQFDLLMMPKPARCSRYRFVIDMPSLNA